MTERLVCGECGSPYKRCTWAKNGVKRIVWRCTSRLEFGRRYCTQSPTIDEYRLHEAIVEAMHRLVADKDEIVENLQRHLQLAVDGDNNAADIIELQQRLEELELHQNTLIDLSLNDNADGSYDEQLRQVMGEKQEATERLRELELGRAISANSDARLRELSDMISAMPAEIAEYDDMLTMRSVERVTVVDGGTVRVRFYGVGVELDVRLKE